MRDKFKNIYSMSTMKSISQRKRTVKNIIGTILIAVAIILVIVIICINQHIKKIQISKLNTIQMVAYQQSEQLEEKEEQKREQQEIEKKVQNNVPQLTEEGKQRFSSIFRSEIKRAFLTFDDGPSTVTSSILQTLNEKNVKATFFMLGTNAEKMPDMVKTAFQEGHYIANHGYSHVYSTIYETPQSVLDEYNKTNNIIKKAIEEPEFNSHLFRFPGGYAGGKYAGIKEQAKELLEQNEVFNIDWNCLTGDAEVNQATPEYIMQRLQATSNGKNSIIILMHDAPAKKTTADTLPQIIDYLAEQGYEFKTFYDIF